MTARALIITGLTVSCARAAAACGSSSPTRSAATEIGRDRRARLASENVASNALARPAMGGWPSPRRWLTSGQSGSWGPCGVRATPGLTVPIWILGCQRELAFAIG
jgi:hypothetical protein